MHKLQSITLHTALLFCSFLVGVIGGCAMAFVGQPGAGLRSYISDHLLLASGGGLSVPLWSAVFTNLRWPLAVFTLAFTPFTIVAIPILLLLRGFFLAYTTTCLSVLLGTNGLTVTILLLSVSLFLEIPALFMFSCEALHAARLSDPGHRTSFRTEVLLIGSGLLIVAIVAQLTVIPEILSAVCTRFSS